MAVYWSTKKTKLPLALGKDLHLRVPVVRDPFWHRPARGQTPRTDFFEYLQVVHDALGRDGPKCNMEMKKAINSVEDIIDDPNKWEHLDGNLF